MWWLYYAGIYLLVFGIRISSIWNTKADQWLEGRKNWKRSLEKIPPKKFFRIWFHVSSLGEFEQAKPVIEKIKKEEPAVEVILTFFSPSGYRVRNHYSFASVHYLPPDIPGNAKIFLGAIRPDLAVFVKYDLWPGYLKQLYRNNIHAILISAHWDPQRKWSSGSFALTKKYLKDFKCIFLQRKEHMDFFTGSGFNNLAVAGDTRIDRSLLLPAEIEKRLPKIFSEIHSFDLVAGSTWPRDEAILIPAIKALNLRAIIAPHDVSAQNIGRLTASLDIPYKLYSNIDADGEDYKLLIIDCIGLLSVLYAAGNMAYVGGGFGNGIHNILEPAAHKKPVIFGPRHQKFPEAIDLISSGGAWSVESFSTLKSILELLLNKDRQEVAGKIAFDYLMTNQGATDIVTNYILTLLPQTVTE